MFQKLKGIPPTKSFHIIIIALITITVIAAGIYLFKPFTNKGSYQYINTDELSKNQSIYKHNLESLNSKSDKDIDSLLFNFGIKKEWISTKNFSVRNEGSKADKKKTDKNKVLWYTKQVNVPGDLNCAEINLELTNHLKFIGLNPAVTEDIRTKDITFTIFEDTVSKSKIPLAKIFITHVNKLKRESGTFVIILNNVADYTDSEAEEVLKSSAEFSFIFPRSLENIDLQNKLVHLKRDIIINVTVGEKENYETDFRLGMDKKELKERVKSFNDDFPGIKHVIISMIDLQSETLEGTDGSISNDVFINELISEFKKFGIITFQDTIAVNFSNYESNNKVKNIVNKLTSLQNKIAIVALSYEEFRNFYNEVLILKKRGYKFYNFSDFIKKENESQKKQLKLGETK